MNSPLFEKFDWYALVDLLLPCSLFSFLLPAHAEVWMLFILAFWLAIKMSIRATRDKAYFYILAVFFVTLPALFRPMTISSLSDLLLVLFAFVAGVGCSLKQWRLSLWILASMGIVGLFALNFIYEPGGVRFFSIDSVSGLLPRFRIMIGEMHVNLSGYLLGSVSLVGYGLWRHNRFKARWFAFGFAAIAYGLAFLTGSKASAFLPIASILFAELAWQYRQMIQEKAMLLVMAFLGIGLIFSLMLYLPNGLLSKITTNESARAQVRSHGRRRQRRRAPCSPMGRRRRRALMTAGMMAVVVGTVEGAERGLWVLLGGSDTSNITERPTSSMGGHSGGGRLDAPRWGGGGGGGL